MHRISIEQWRMFIAVVDCGGFAQAGDALYKTQSTVSHSVRKLEQTIGKGLFEVQGRRAVLTPFGESLLPAARALVSQADSLEHEAISHRQSVNATLSIAIDSLYPRPTLYGALARFKDCYPDINVQVHETVLSRTAELLEDGTVVLGIASAMPKNVITQLITTVDLIAVAAATSPLHSNRRLTLPDLEQECQVVIRDAGLRANMNSGWLGSHRRVTVSNVAELSQALAQGIGFGWLPVWAQQAQPLVEPLPLSQGLIRTVALQLGIQEHMADDERLMLLQKLLLEPTDGHSMR